MTTFPHPEHFFGQTGITPEQLTKGTEVSIDGAVLRHLIEMALGYSNIDEAVYRRYADIDTALNDGVIDSASDHYRKSGFFEGRFAPSRGFDEDWYVKQYPDVALAIKSGEVATGLEHYLEMGYKEWRASSAANIDDVRNWRKLLK